MFSGLFNYDNPVWRFIGKFGDLILLNVLWLVCSIPLFTIGASTTAVYYVTLRLVRNEDGYTIKSFFKSFKENFKQATIIWLIVVVVGVILGFDLYFFGVLQKDAGTIRTVMLSVFLALTLIYTAMVTYVFPLQSRFYNTIKKTLFNAFFMSIRHLLYTICMVIINVGVIFLAFQIPQILMLLMLFGFPLVAFINSYVLAPIFEKYIPTQVKNDGEMKPLFADENMKPKQDDDSKES